MKKILTAFTMVLLVSCTGKQQKEISRYSAEQFYKNVSLTGGSFSPDETKLLVGSNESGIFNVFEISIADGTRRQLTSSTTDSYFPVDYVHGTKDILYSADKGGNENSHIYLLKEDGSVTDLTPGDAVKAIFNGWSKDKKTMYFQSNKRDPQFFDIYKMTPGVWKEEMVYKNAGGYDLGVSTRDRSIISIQKAISTSENQLFLYNSSSGSTVEISEPDNPGIYNGSGFSGDKKYFYYTTDAGKEFTYLVSYEIPTGNRNVIYETDWDIAMAGLSENDKYRAIVINEDARYVLKLFDAATGREIQYPAIPGSNILNVNISDSEKSLMLMLGTSKSAGDIYVCRFGDPQLNKITSTMNPEIEPDNLASARMVRFPSFDGLNIPAVYYKPLSASVRNKVPALVMVHGGPGGQSTIDYSPLIQFLVNHNYAVLAVNNRGSSGYGKSFFRMDDRDHGGKDLNDCIWGKVWLKGQDYIDSTKIGIIGGSYGGFMTMAAMTFHPDDFRVGVDFFGVTNWIRTLKSTPAWWASFRDALFREMGDPYSADSVMLYNVSPLFHADNIKNPIMVLQGANDPRVLKVESDEIVEAVKAKGVPVDYIVFPDEGHGFQKKDNEIMASSRILAFLDRYLKGIK